MPCVVSKPTLALDHLVLAARTLDEGTAWCEAAFGILPDAGGTHAWMGTHNRVFALASAQHPRAYFEVIAIDPNASAPGRARWFDLDDPALRRTLARGPQLVHWVARSNAIDATRAALKAAGADCGDLHAAERATPAGMLRWRISVRADGGRALGGAVPALIEWRGAHPTETLPVSGVVLESMRLGAWPETLGTLLPPDIGAGAGAPLVAVLVGPAGRVELTSV